MGDIADDCFDRGIDELFDSYDNHDQYEEMRQYFKMSHLPATREEVLDDFEDEDQITENDLEGLLYGAVQQSIWDYGERNISAIVNAVMRVLTEQNYIQPQETKYNEI